MWASPTSAFRAHCHYDGPAHCSLPGIQRTYLLTQHSRSVRGICRFLHSSDIKGHELALGRHTCALCSSRQKSYAPLISLRLRTNFLVRLRLWGVCALTHIQFLKESISLLFRLARRRVTTRTRHTPVDKLFTLCNAECSVRINYGFPIRLILSLMLSRLIPSSIRTNPVTAAIKSQRRSRSCNT